MEKPRLNNKEAQKARNKVSEWMSRLADIRSACPHDNGTYRYASNTGNYDPSCDCYWIHCECHDCGEVFRTYSKVTEDGTYYGGYVEIPRKKGWQQAKGNEF